MDEVAAQPFPVLLAGGPFGAGPGLVEHRAVLAEPEDVEPVRPPRGDRRRAREGPAQPLPRLVAPPVAVALLDDLEQALAAREDVSRVVADRPRPLVLAA